MKWTMSIWKDYGRLFEKRVFNQVSIWNREMKYVFKD